MIVEDIDLRNIAMFTSRRDFDEDLADDRSL
jgi:hypothetical protein